MSMTACQSKDCLSMATCQVNLSKTTCPSLGYCQWRLARAKATRPSQGHLPKSMATCRGKDCSSKSRLLVRDKATCPSHGYLSKSWLLVQVMATCPSHGYWSKSWLLVQVMATSPSHGY